MKKEQSTLPEANSITIRNNFNVSYLLSQTSQSELPIHYRKILDSAPEGIVVIDRQGICVYCNRSCLKILNYATTEDLLGKKLHQLIHHTHPDGTSYSSHQCKIFKAAIQGVKIAADNEVFWTADGKAIPVSYSCYPEFKDETLTGTIIIFSDITREINQKNKSETHQIEYRSIFNSTNIGVLHFDKDGQIISANQTLQYILQYSLTELQQMNFRQIVHKEDWEEEIILRREVLSGKRHEYNIEERYIRKDGEPVWINASVSSYQKASSSSLCFTAVVIDISDRKKCEQQLVESNEVKEKYFSIITKDLRNPVGSIKMISDFIKEEHELNNTSKLQEFTDLLFAQIRNTYDLLDDLLGWTTAKKEPLAFNPVRLNVEQIFRRHIASYKILAENKQISLQYINDKQLMVKADTDMLDTVLRHLITNSIKSSPENSKIILAAEDRSDDILISVEDQSEEIPSDILEKLFLTDSPINITEANNNPITGFGLLSCKKFIQQHKGKIWVESEPSKGNKFLFTLPKAL